METYFKRYPGQVTTASVIHSDVRGDITLYTTIEDLKEYRPVKKRKEKLTKWDMKDIRSSSSTRHLRLTEEEHDKFEKALDTPEGKKAIADLKNSIINREVNQVIDFIHTNVLKSQSLKNVIGKLKEENLTEYGTKSASSLAITIKQMYDHLVQSGIIKIEQPINV